MVTLRAPEAVRVQNFWLPRNLQQVLKISRDFHYLRKTTRNVQSLNLGSSRSIGYDSPLSFLLLMI